MIIPFGERSLGSLILDGIKIPPTDYILFTKGKKFLSQQRKLTVTMITVIQPHQ